MLKSLILILFIPVSTFAQENTDQYLATHHHPFTLEAGFSEQTKTTLEKQLSDYRILFMGEGGSHFLQFFEPLQLIWLQLLHEKFNAKHLFIEAGYASTYLSNEYLEKGDTTLQPQRLSKRMKNYLRILGKDKNAMATAKQFHETGIDFERAASYFQALQHMLPDSPPPASIADGISQIRKADLGKVDCASLTAADKILKQSLQQFREDYKTYLKHHFENFAAIVTNEGSCHDVRKDRNPNMAKRLLQFDQQYQDRFYFAQLGLAHTMLKYKSTATIVNNSAAFKNKVAVVNTYCLDCTTEEEQVSNWQLRAIEKDTNMHLLKYCTADFTLFDFTGDNAFAAKMRKYGQFLIIAKKQR